MVLNVLSSFSNFKFDFYFYSNIVALRIRIKKIWNSSTTLVGKEDIIEGIENIKWKSCVLMTLCCSSAKFFGEDEKCITLKEVYIGFALERLINVLV